MALPAWKPTLVEVKGVVVDGTARLEADPLKSFPGKCSGCLCFDPAESETACKEDGSSNQVGGDPKPGCLHPDHPDAEHLVDPDLVVHIVILSPEGMVDCLDWLVSWVFNILQLILQFKPHLVFVAHIVHRRSHRSP